MDVADKDDKISLSVLKLEIILRWIQLILEHRLWQHCHTHTHTPARSSFL